MLGKSLVHVLSYSFILALLKFFSTLFVCPMVDIRVGGYAPCMRLIKIILISIFN